MVTVINETPFHKTPFPNSQGVALAKLASGHLLPVKRSNCIAWVVGQDRTEVSRVAFFKLIFEICDFILKNICKVIQAMLYLIHQVRNTTKIIGGDYMLPDVNDIYLNQYLDNLDEQDNEQDLDDYDED